MTDRTASVGLRVYLQDEISTGLVEIGDWVLELGKAFGDFGQTASSSFNDLIDYTRLATESVTGLYDAMTNLATATKDDATGTTTATTATEDLATASTNAATATKDATIAIDEMNVSIVQTTIDIDETSGHMGNMGEAFLAIMVGQQIFQSLDTAVQGAVTSSGDLQDSFIRAQIATKATGDDVAILNQAIVDLSDQGMYSTTEIADGFQLMGQRGYDTTQIVQDGLGKAVMNLAEVTKGEMLPTTDLLTTALHDFGGKASDAGRYASALAYAAMNGIPDMNGLASALMRVGPSAEGLHVPFETIISSLIFLSTHGMPDVSQAGTTLNYMLQAMAAPTGTAATMLKNIGVSFYDMQGHLKPLPDMIQQLFDQLNKYPDSKASADLRQLFNIRSGAGGRIMGNDPNIKQDLNNSSNNIKHAENTNYLQQNIDKLRGDFNQTLARLQSTWNSTMALMFMPVVQWLTPIINNLNLFVTGLGNANPQVKTFIAVLGGILLIVGPIALLAIGIGLVVVVLGTALLPVMAVVGTLAGLIVIGALIATNWSKIQSFFAPLEPLFTNIGILIKSSFAPALVQMKNGWNEIVQAMGPLMAQLKPLAPLFGLILLVIISVVVGLLSALGPAIGSIVRMLAGMLAGIITVVTGVIQFVKGAVQFVIGLVGMFVGLITGNKTLTNQMSHMLSTGLSNMVGGLLKVVQGALQMVIAVNCWVCHYSGRGSRPLRFWCDWHVRYFPGWQWTSRHYQ